jgi:flagellar biogenesis protein FliO
VGSPLGDYLIQSVVVLLVILVLAAVVLLAARRTGLGRALGPVEVLARLPLEARRSVYVVRIVDQILILGSSEAGITRLGELPEAAVAELRPALGATGFATVLAALGRRAPLPDATPDTRSSRDGGGAR